MIYTDSMKKEISNERKKKERTRGINETYYHNESRSHMLIASSTQYILLQKEKQISNEEKKESKKKENKPANLPLQRLWVSTRRSSKERNEISNKKK